jgi:hypothetical protein
MFSNEKRLAEVQRGLQPSDQGQDARRMGSEAKWGLLRETQRPRAPQFFSLHAFSERVTWIR